MDVKLDVKLDTIISLLGGVSKELQTLKRARNGKEEEVGKADVWSNLFLTCSCRRRPAFILE